jgi:hypothetical protein
VKNKKSGEGVWSCCRAEEKEAVGCVQGTHKFANYPDEEAKKYFFDKHLKHPSHNWLRSKETNTKTDFELYGRFCGFFRTPAPYKPKNPRKRVAQLSADEEKKLLLKDKICLNWACGKIFKQGKNHKKACKCHPGKWDFGYSGQNVSAGAGGIDPDEQLWQPHWTCCRGPWEAEGCRKTYHVGQFLEDYNKEPRKYQWPDWRVQTYFKKTGSYNWQQKLDAQYSYDDETLLKKFKKIVRDEGSGGVSISF